MPAGKRRLLGGGEEEEEGEGKERAVDRGF